jgi:iron uptake system EfeUOB component EfeO/EfeM
VWSKSSTVAEYMSNFQVHTVNPGNKTCKERSQYTKEQAWENLKEDVEHLYVTQRLDLKEVQACLRSQGKYNFEAT